MGWRSGPVPRSALLLVCILCAAQRAAAAADGCYFVSLANGTDLRGGDLVGATQTTFETIGDCCQLCQDTPGCSAFSWNVRTLACALRATTGWSTVTTISKDVVAAVMAPAPACPAGGAMFTSGNCTQVPNTLLVTQDDISTSTEDSADLCCTRCRNTPNCTLWAYCPKTAKDGCYTSYSGGYSYPSSGGCTLYALKPGEQPTVTQQGPETLWVSGYYNATATPPGPAVPSLPPASSVPPSPAAEPSPSPPSPTPAASPPAVQPPSPTTPSPSVPPSTVPPASPPAAAGACTQVPNTLLVYSDDLSTSTVDTAEDCCTRCRNTPDCTLWAYCPKTTKDGCYTSYTNGYAYPNAGGCTLYAMEAGKQAAVDQQGPETPWISGYYTR